MKNDASFPLLSNKFKVVGLSITSAAGTLLILQKATGNSLFQSFPEQQSQFLFLLISFGLYIIAFSKETVDDDRIRIIRSKSVQAGFMLVLSTMIAFSLVSIIRHLSGFQNDFSLVAFLSVLFYLILFNYKIYFSK